MLNKAILIGRFTKDPEMRYSNNNTAVCKSILAVDRRYTKPGEEKQADFIPIVAFGKTAEFIGKYFQKGNKIAVVGSIQTRSWDGEDGKKHYATEVIVEEASFVESRGSGGNAAGNSSGQTDGFYPVEDDDELPFNLGLTLPR